MIKKKKGRSTGETAEGETGVKGGEGGRSGQGGTSGKGANRRNMVKKKQRTGVQRGDLTKSRRGTSRSRNNKTREGGKGKRREMTLGRKMVVPGVDRNPGLDPVTALFTKTGKNPLADRGKRSPCKKDQGNGQPRNSTEWETWERHILFWAGVSLWPPHSKGGGETLPTVGAGGGKRQCPLLGKARTARGYRGGCNDGGEWSQDPKRRNSPKNPKNADMGARSLGKWMGENHSIEYLQGCTRRSPKSPATPSEPKRGGVEVARGRKHQQANNNLFGL